MSVLRIFAVAAFMVGAVPCGWTAERVPMPVWLDVDVAAGLPDRDVDDALALIQAFHSPELEVRGVSAVYGNAPLLDGLPIAREVVEKFGPKGLVVHSGAAKAEQLGERTDAVDAMAAALRKESLTLLALGPLTNVGTLLQLHPELHERITSIVMFAARRPYQRFTYPEANGQAFADFNFENDPAAMQIILDSSVALAFAPWEVSSHVWMTKADLDQLAQSSASGKWVADRSRGWLQMWRDRFKTPGFNPFDTLAVGWLTHPDLIHSFEAGVWMETLEDDTGSPSAGTIPTKPYLLVDPDSTNKRRATYAYEPRPEFKQVLVQRLMGLTTAEQ